MIHKACMPVYMNSGKIVAGRMDGRIGGSTRGPRRPKKNNIFLHLLGIASLSSFPFSSIYGYKIQCPQISRPCLLLNWRAFEPKKNLLVLFEIGAYIFVTQILKLAPMKNMIFSFLMLGSIKTTFGPLRSLTAMHIIWPYWLWHIS